MKIKWWVEELVRQTQVGVEEEVQIHQNLLGEAEVAQNHQIPKGVEESIRLVLDYFLLKGLEDCFPSSWSSQVCAAELIP